jgi:hypothetical protein
MKINNNWSLKLLYYIRVLQDKYYAKTNILLILISRL